MTDKRQWVAQAGIREAWLAQTREAIVDPGREIIDPHHHLWDRGGARYELAALWSDTGDGHRVTKTVFIECGMGYRENGPEHLRPVGETEYVARIADAAAAEPGRAQIVGIVAHADLRSPDLDEILDAHAEAAGGRLVGIRHSGAHEPAPEALTIPGRAPFGLYRDEAFRRGVARLGERGLTYDTWHYHHQNADFRDLAAAAPGTVMILDHFGTPLGVGQYEGARAEIFARWKDDVAAIAERPNVIAKLGGMAMPDNGWGWHARARPVGSDDFVAAQGPWYAHMLALFGAERAMFESNFPVDRASISYHVLWNGLKKLAADRNEAEQELLFRGTAARVYGL